MSRNKSLHIVVWYLVWKVSGRRSHFEHFHYCHDSIVSIATKEEHLFAVFNCFWPDSSGNYRKTFYFQDENIFKMCFKIIVWETDTLAMNSWAYNCFLLVMLCWERHFPIWLPKLRILLISLGKLLFCSIIWCHLVMWWLVGKVFERLQLWRIFTGAIATWLP